MGRKVPFDNKSANYNGQSLGNGRSTLRQAAQSELRRSRLTVLCGWLVAMLGVALYCSLLLMTPAITPDAGLLAYGWPGSLALTLLSVGVMLWLYGAASFLQAADQAPDDKTPTGPSF